MNYTNCLHTNFSDEMLNQAKAGLERLYNAKEKLEFTISNLSESAIKDEEKYPSCAMSEIKEVIGEL